MASGLLLAHLVAIFIAPWSSPEPSPAIAQILARNLEPYLVGAYLNHGYRFFAPDPGPSHILRYELTLTNGDQLVGQLPDTKRNRPRLLYHRFFMLTETMFSAWRNIEVIPSDAPISPERRQLIAERSQYNERLLAHLARGIANQLLIQEGATSVRLLLQEHMIPLPEDVAAGRPLNDPALYVTLIDLGQFEPVQE